MLKYPLFPLIWSPDLLLLFMTNVFSFVICWFTLLIFIAKEYEPRSDCSLQSYCLLWFVTSQSTIFQLLWDRPSWVAGSNVSCSRTQHSDAGEARTRSPSVLSQALYHWATVLPHTVCFHAKISPECTRIHAADTICRRQFQKKKKNLAE